MVEHQGIAPCTPAWKAGMYLSTLMLEKGGNLRIQFSHWHFDRIRFVLPDAASRRFHATRPKPQLRKPAWLPFYTGGDSSLQLGLSAFIFRLPCGQQRSIAPPCESNRPPPPLRGNGRPDCASTQGLSHFRTQPRTRLCVQAWALNPQPANYELAALPLS